MPVPDVAAEVLAALKPRGPLADAVVARARALRGVRVPRADFDPRGCRPTCGCVPGRGRARARSSPRARPRRAARAGAPRLRAELATAARGARAQRADAWTIGELPRASRCRARAAVRGYPALVDEGESVGVRVFETPAAQAAAMAAGTRRLLLLGVPSPIRGVQAGLTNAQRLALAGAPHGGVGAVLEDAPTAALDALIAEAGGPAWDAGGFARLRGHVAGRLPAKTGAVVAAVAAILDAARDVERRLEPLTAPAFEPARRDVARPARPARVPRLRAATGAARLADVERYLHGAARRLERLPDATAGDRDRMRALQRARAGVPPAARRVAARARAARRAARGPVDARGAARQPLRPGARHARAGVGEADPARARGGRPELPPARTRGVRRRRRSSFSSSPDGLGRVRWLQPASRAPPPARRRSCRSSAGAGTRGRGRSSVGAARRQAAGDRRQEAVERFTTAWERGDYPAMWRSITPERRRDWPLAQFAASYRIAAQQATVKSVEVRTGAEPVEGRAPVRVRVRTRDFGDLRGTIPLRVVERDGEPYLDWSPAWRLPGLREAENVRRRVLARPERRPIIAGDGSRLDAEPTAASIAGSAPAGDEPGSGLQALYDQRLGGRPGAELRFGKRIVKRVEVKRGRALRRRSRRACSGPPRPRSATGSAASPWSRPRTGSVLAHGGHRGLGSAAAGLHVQDHHAVRRAAGGHREAVERLSGADGRDALRRPAAQREQRVLRRLARHLVRALVQLRLRAARAPSSARKRLIRRGGLRLQREPRLPDAKPSTIARDLRDDLAVGSAAIGQERDLATAVQMASVGATIANHGVRMRPRIVALGAGGRRRVVPRGSPAGPRHDARRGARRDRRRGRAPGRRGGRQDRHRRAAPDGRRSDRPEEHGRVVRGVRAGLAPKVAVAVMLVGAGQGGATAAPLARQVLAAAL